MRVITLVISRQWVSAQACSFDGRTIILKPVRDLSDESMVEQWSENNYYRYFRGKQEFQPRIPCEASELIHFRHRIEERY